MSTWSFVKWNKVHGLCRYRQLCHSTFLLQNSREARMSSGGSSWSTVAYCKLFKSSFHCWLWIALPCYQECSVSRVCAHKGNSKRYWLQRRYPSDIFSEILCLLRTIILLAHCISTTVSIQHVSASHPYRKHVLLSKAHLLTASFNHATKTSTSNSIAYSSVLLTWRQYF